MNQPLDSHRGGLARQNAGGPFGPRLRMERERRRITLDSIAANTKISVGLLKSLEQDNVSRWPSGIFRRSFIKAYAEAIGLDPEETAREFLERFPDQEALARLQEDRPAAEPPRAAAANGFRLTLVHPEPSFTRGCLLQAVRSRVSAVAWDMGVVLIVAMSLFVLLDQFWRPLGIFSLVYYTGGICLLGNTPGVCLFAAAGASHRPAAVSWAAGKSAMVKARIGAFFDSARRPREDSAKRVNAD